MKTSELPRASVADTIGVLLDVILPTIMKGVIIRRPGAVALAEKLDLDRRAVKRMQHLHRTYGRGPVLLRLPIREQAIVLDPEDVRRVLNETPDPFSTASTEKRAALSHFEPRGALVSEGVDRARRRRHNEQALQNDREVHEHGQYFVDVVEDEAARLLASLGVDARLTWDAFIEAWMRIVRRVVFGDAARDDERITEVMADLRGRANWAMFAPEDRGARHRLFEIMEGYLADPGPGSLFATIRSMPVDDPSAVLHQVPQWLFAFDPAGMTTFRALALLATHPEAATRAREEYRSSTPAERAHLPFLRATVLDSLRLWPTTPMILRQTSRDAAWNGATMRESTGVLIFAPYFHRDENRLAEAHRFAPELWLGDRDWSADYPLVPFSGGPGICPGRHVVSLTSSVMLGALVGDRDVQLVDGPSMGPDVQLPGTLNPYGLTFHLTPLRSR